MGKYITLIYDEPYTSSAGENIYRIVNSTKTFTSTELATLFTPYTEPDIEQIRNDAYSKGHNDGLKVGYENLKAVECERIDKAYKRGYDDAKHECQDCQKIMMDAEQERVDKAYQQGVSDAENRRATCEFCEYRFLDEDEEPCRKCACNYLNKFRPKKEKIQIGDEVRSIERGWTAIVTRLKEGYLTLMDNNGEIANGYVENMFTKTGRHFPEIAEVLQKMNEDDG